MADAKGRDSSSAAGGALKRIVRSAIVEHSAQAMYALVEDIEAYPQFLPWCIETKVLTREPDRTRATLTVAIKGVRQSFTTDNTQVPGQSIDMRLVEGPFSRFAAAWRFTGLGENAARIEFSLEFEFSSKVLAKMLNPLFDHIADTMVGSFSRRADVLYGKTSSN